MCCDKAGKVSPSPLTISHQHDLCPPLAAALQRDEKSAGLPLGKSQVWSLKSKVQSAGASRHSTSRQQHPLRSRSDPDGCAASSATSNLAPRPSPLRMKSASSAPDAKSAMEALQTREIS